MSDKNIIPTTLRPTFSKNEHSIPLNIVWDAAIARKEFSDGKLFPLLIVDCTNRKDLRECIALHEDLDEGDFRCMWLQQSNRTSFWNLYIETISPVICNFIIDFEITKHGVLVEAILHSRGFYLQAGSAGDSFKSTLDKPRVFFDMPATGVRKKWDRIFLSAHTKKNRASGASRGVAKKLANARLKSTKRLARTKFVFR